MVEQSWNGLGQLESLGSVASFTWMGPRPRTRTAGPTSLTSGYDSAGRLTSRRTDVGPASRVSETLQLDARGLRTGVIRYDLGELGWSWSLDKAGRLLEANRRYFEGGQAAEGSGRQIASQPLGYAFTYDAAENLVEKRRMGRCAETRTALPVDASGRNRPGRLDTTELVWDDAGRLKENSPHQPVGEK